MLLTLFRLFWKIATDVHSKVVMPLLVTSMVQ